MNSIQLMSDVVHYLKYARYLNDFKRRETWEENVSRTRDMHAKRYPSLAQEIKEVFDRFVMPKLVLPSMRSMQYGGTPIELNNSRVYNCAYLPIDDRKAFREIIFLLLSGNGVGYSVQQHHVTKLPSIRKPNKAKKYMIADDVVGWSNAVDALMRAYFEGGFLPLFDFRDIRAKGSPLKTAGGKAPGPEPLRKTLNNIKAVLDSKESGDKLTPIECHDIACYLADAVMSGGIREAAMIALFSSSDNDMLRCKSNFHVKTLDEKQINESLWQVLVEVNGWMKPRQHTIFVDKEHYEMLNIQHKLPWWYFEPQRGRANNSVMLLRSEESEFVFRSVWKQITESGCGEPGIYFTNSLDAGCNPCVEIALDAMQYCNLSECNVSNISSQEDLEQRVKAATFIGTLQAGYTDFHYLRDAWKETTERDALLGVSLTGLSSLNLTNFDFRKAAQVAKNENKRVADLIGIKHAARICTVKPAGSTSLVMGCSSGIHAWHDKFYVRRLRLNKIESLYGYLMNKVPSLIEDSQLDPNNTAYLCIPVKAPDGAITEHSESADQFLERVKHVYHEWVAQGHHRGDNTNNVSATVKVRPHEWEQVGDWMWKNRNSYNGLSVLPYDGGTYVQAPFESITEEHYNKLIGFVADVDLSEVSEMQDFTKTREEPACAGGVCSLAV
jgi:ribonucleoside-diphosphate reductase alpha chain